MVKRYQISFKTLHTRSLQATEQYWQTSAHKPQFLRFLLWKKSLKSPNLYYLVVKQLWFGGKQSVAVLTLDFHNRAGKGDLLALGSQSLEPCCSWGARGAGGHSRAGDTGWHHCPRGNAYDDLALWQGHHRGVHSRRFVEQILGESKQTGLYLTGLHLAPGYFHHQFSILLVQLRRNPRCHTWKATTQL